MLSIIAAVARNNALGRDNKMPWHLPNDLKRFRKITSGHTIIMGRKTFLSLPNLLPNRYHIVLTRDKSFQVKASNVKIVHSIAELMEIIDKQEENFVIGGGEIYTQLLPYAQKLYLTLIDKEYEADTFFPEIDYSKWKVIEKQVGIQDAKNPLPHTFITYERI